MAGKSKSTLTNYARHLAKLALHFNELPTIKRAKKLPVVLSQEEVRRLLKVPSLLKHRILIGLLYGCGLRCFEVRNLRIADLDFERKALHVKDGKGKKDRYVPLADILIRGLKAYLEAEQPGEWVFNSADREIRGRAGGDFDSRYSQRGVQWAVNQAKKEPRILETYNPRYCPCCQKESMVSIQRIPKRGPPKAVFSAVTTQF